MKYKCNGCGLENIISGEIYKCENCFMFYFCGKCYMAEGNNYNTNFATSHKNYHNMVKIEMKEI